MLALLPAKAQECLAPARGESRSENGMAQTEAARVFGLARGTINGWRAGPGGKACGLCAPVVWGVPAVAPGLHQAATAVRMILQRLSRIRR